VIWIQSYKIQTTSTAQRLKTLKFNEGEYSLLIHDKKLENSYICGYNERFFWNAEKLFEDPSENKKADGHLKPKLNSAIYFCWFIKNNYKMKHFILVWGFHFNEKLFKKFKLSLMIVFLCWKWIYKLFLVFIPKKMIFHCSRTMMVISTNPRCRHYSICLISIMFIN
jgi:hypothetical protein